MDKKESDWKCSMTPPACPTRSVRISSRPCGAHLSAKNPAIISPFRLISGQTFYDTGGEKASQRSLPSG